MNPAILRLLGPIAIVLMLAGLGFYLHHSGVQAGKREVQALWDAEKSQAQALVIKAQQDNQRKTDQRIADLQKANDEANVRSARSAADAASATNALDSLRKSEARRIAGLGRVSASASASCQCEADTQGSNLFLRCAERYADLGRKADRAYDAGKLCEAIYDALGQ